MSAERQRLSSAGPWWEPPCPHCGHPCDLRGLELGDRLLCVCGAWLELSWQGADAIWKLFRRPSDPSSHTG